MNLGTFRINLPTIFFCSAMKPTAQHLVIWCDSCGGQNRSIKTCLSLDICMRDAPNLKTITLKYFTSGHSFNYCDSDFANVERAIKRNVGNIFDYDDLYEIVRASKSNDIFTTRMRPQDFMHLGDSLSKIVNRKKDTDGQKFSWLKIHELKVTKSMPLTIAFKYNINDDYRYFSIAKYETVVDDNKRKRVPIPFSDLNLVNYPSDYSIPINEKKLEDLISLRLKFIPEEKSSFWSFLDDCSTSTEAETVEELMHGVFDVDEPGDFSDDE